ncbi:MAG: Ig-like domain-containing protein [Prevotella sp.]|nr:Ig-like domain-containing protein [Prevotella sp.]
MEKNRRWGILCLLLLVPLFASAQTSFKDFKVDLTNGNLLTETEISEKSALSLGIAVADDGTISRVADDATDAVAVLKGKFHSNEHGWQNFSATVTVPGPVRISFGTCAWGGDVTVKTQEGETATTFNTNTGACYHQNKDENIVSAYYKGGATTLTISGGSYVPYFAVESVDISDIPSDMKIVYSLGDNQAEGTLPADDKAEAGSDYTLPINHTLYVAGKTLTAWTDGTNSYKPGDTFKMPNNDITLTAVFTDNEVSLNDRTESVELLWDFQRKNGAPLLSYQNKTGIYVTQGIVNGHAIDVKLDFDTNNGGKLANGNWTDWAQMNAGTKFTVPSCKGAVVSMEAYSAITTTTIDGQTDYASANTISYTIANTAETIDIVIGDGSYYRYIKVVLPIAASSGKTFDNVAANIVWDLNDVDNYATPNTLQPDNAYSLATVNVGDFTVTVGAPDDKDGVPNRGVKMLKLQPTGESNTSIEFIVKPAKGLTFTPSNVYAKVTRFGTDAGTLTVTARNAEGTEVQLGTGLIPARNNKTKETDAKGSDPNWCYEFSYSVPAELLTSESFSLVVTEDGLATNKQWGIGDVHIEGTVNGTTEDVNKYTLTLNANPVEGGTVNVYPQGTEFDEGTELKLTATKNFGYKFINWTDAEGNVVSTDNVFVYTLSGNSELTANFEAVKTYELKYNVAGGANLYQVQPNPKPVVVDGKNMYEEGTQVTLTATSNAILTFNSWSNQETNSEIKVDMNSDVELTATFSVIDYIVGWDFFLPGNSSRVADFYSTPDNDATQLVLIDADGNTAAWLDKSTQAAGGYESMAGAAVNWKEVGRYHYQTKVNARDFSNIRVMSQLLYNYNAYTHIDLEWSADGTNWQKAGSIDMAAPKSLTECNFTLPAEANHTETLYLRWMPDTNGAIDGTQSDNDGTAITNIFLIADADVYDDGVAPVLVSTVPANGSKGVSASGRIVLNFDERVQMADDVVGYINDINIKSIVQNPTKGVVSGKTITFEYKGLTYSTEYNFTLQGKSISDLAGNTLVDAINVSFTTMDKPTVNKELYDFIVPDDGTFKEALTAASTRSDKSKRYRIFVRQGDYIIPANDQNMVAGNDGKSYPDPKTSFASPNVSIIGENMEFTTVANQMPNDLTENSVAGAGGMANPLEGIRTSGLLYLTSGATNTYFQDITLKTNTADNTGRNVILVDGGNKTICKNVCLWAYQDTYVSDNTRGMFYFEDGLLRGRTDFLCGSGDVYYNRVTLQMCERGGYIAVPRDNQKYGYVFKDCTIRGEKADVNGNYYLGRPWTEGAEVYYIDTRMEVVPYGIGWAEMSDGGCTRMAEYNSVSASGNPIDLSGRATSLGKKTPHPNNPIITAEEAAIIGDPANTFGDWQPQLYTEQAPVPVNVTLHGNTLTWSDSPYVLLWAVCKNDRVVAFTTDPTYTIATEDMNGIFTVRAANEMGGLSEPSEPVSDPSGVQEINNDDSDIISTTYYNVAGHRVSSSATGIILKIDMMKNGKHIASKIVR